jgi:hypothetical protein
MERQQKRPVGAHVLELMTTVKVLEMLVAILLADKFTMTEDPKRAGDDLVNQATNRFDAAQGKPNRTSMEMAVAVERIVDRAVSVALGWSSKK